MVSLLKKLAALFTPEGRRETYAHWLTVACNRCGERIRTRVDLRNDLSVDYGESDQDTRYYCRKVLVGSGRCFQQITVELTFDAQRQLIEQKIEGGSFIEEEDDLEQHAG